MSSCGGEGFYYQDVLVSTTVNTMSRMTVCQCEFNRVGEFIQGTRVDLLSMGSSHGVGNVRALFTWNGNCGDWW